MAYYNLVCHLYFFFFKQQTAYEMRISDWSSDVCSSDLHAAEDRLRRLGAGPPAHARRGRHAVHQLGGEALLDGTAWHGVHRLAVPASAPARPDRELYRRAHPPSEIGRAHV